MAENTTYASALQHHEAGNLKEADRLYREVLSGDPANGDALHALASIGAEIGDMQVALQLLERAIRSNPDNPQYWESMANTCMHLNELEKALQAFQKALTLGGRNADMFRNFAIALLRAGRPAKAAELLEEVVNVRPEDSLSLFQLANANAAQDKWQEAITHFEQAIKVSPKYAVAHTNLGFAHLNRPDPNPMEAVVHLEKGFRLKRQEAATNPALATYNMTSLPKLRHDVEQFAYLKEIGELPDEMVSAQQAFEEVIHEIDWASQNNFMVNLTPEQIKRIAPWYNRATHIVDAPALKGPAVNPELDGDALVASYQAEAPGIVFFDDLLTAEALTSLRKFCMESTFWYDFSHFGGYMGAYMDDGFFCPLLVQIAEELRAKMRGVIGDHPLRQLWGYKYDSTLTGISAHADFAAVNVNFWITPDDANLDADRSGLIVYKAEAPTEWDFDSYNNEPEKIRAFLEANDKGSLAVPHRQNRALMFHSDLFHESDALRFKSGYENRRINITMLFGDRDHV